MTTTDRLARRALLERYLLGTLDEGARAVLRSQVIGDPEVFAEVREVELDLLDGLARGVLEPEQRRLVEARLAGDPRNKNAWEVAQAMARHAARASAEPVMEQGTTGPAAPASQAAPRPARPAESRPHLSEWSGTNWTRLSFWPAAAALIFAASVSLYYVTLRPEQPLPELDPSISVSITPAPGIAPAPGAPATGAAPQVSGDAARVTPAPGTTTGGESTARAGVPGGTGASGPERPLPGAGTAGVSSSAPVLEATVASIYLPAAALRGDRPSVHVGPLIQTLRVDVELPDTPSVPVRVDITLRALGQNQLTSPHWAQPGVRVRREQGQPIASITAPARFFPAGPVEVTIAPHVARVTPPPASATPPVPVPGTRVLSFLLVRD